MELLRTWRSLGHRLATATGSCAGLLALLQHAPVTTAVLRGTVAWGVVLVVSQLGLFALDQSLGLEATAAKLEEGAER